MTSKFHKSLNAAFEKFAEKRSEQAAQPSKQSWVISKAQKQLLYDIDNEVIIPTMVTNIELLVLDFICVLDNHKIKRESLLALWRNGLIRYNYRRYVFELTKVGLKFIKLNNERNTPGIINVQPGGYKPYKSKQSLRHEKYINKAQD